LVVYGLSRQERPEHLTAFARLRQGIQFRLHLGDSCELNVKSGSKRGHLQRVLV
jgi:hypothetical protein